MTIRHAVYLPVFGPFADAAVLADLAATAEGAGWDGVFTWDHVAMWWDRAAPVTDTTVALAAIACATKRVRFGALVTPLARRRPVKFAREAVALDLLSGGRLVVGAGLGMNRHEFEELGEEADARGRAALLDESLEVVAALWTGEAVAHRGERHQVAAQFLPVPIQQPRIPIWIAGAWPRRAPFVRAARWDGVVPMLATPGPFDTPPEVYREINSLVMGLRRPDAAAFDMTHAHGDPDLDPDRRRAKVEPYAESGVTWWLEDVGPWRFGLDDPARAWPLDDMRAFIAGGPAR